MRHVCCWIGHLLCFKPAGVWLFRMHAGRCFTCLLLDWPPPGFAWFLNGIEAACQVMSGSCVGLSSSFFRASPSTTWFCMFLEFLERFLEAACQAMSFFNKQNFDAACQVMSGSCVGLSSSFFRASESNVRQFFDGWFWLVGLESCWGFPVSDAC